MKDIKIGPKLIGSYLVIVIVAICTCAYLLRELKVVNENVDDLYGKAVVPLKNMTGTVRLSQMLRITIYQMVLAESKEEERMFKQTMDSLGAEIMKLYKEEEKTLVIEENKIILANAEKAVEDYGSLTNELMTFLDKEPGVVQDPWVVLHSPIISALRDKANEIAANNLAFVNNKERVADEIKNSSFKEYEFARTSSIILMIAMAIVSILAGILITFSITKPLQKIVETLKKGEHGDMRARADIDQKDELGIVAHSVNIFFEQIQKILKNLCANSDTLAGASEELSSVSRQLASGAEETVAQSNTVASTTEQMAVNINAMASAAEQAGVNANEVAGSAEEMSTNMNTIASAVEEMSTSISQIANNTTEVRKVAEEATSKASDATTVMGKLGNAAKEIGHVTDVIKKIADKTNLLALNATIEAASAGDAGKGFAVVAGEIKELANQSAQSADDIARRIEGIQNETGDAVEVIHAVSDIIEKINHSVDAIAGHVDQQTRASNEIASNVAQANTGARRVASAIGEVAKGVTDVSRNAGEAAKGANDVSGSVVGMNQAAKESAQGASQVNQSASDLAKIASELKHTVSQFNV